MEIEGKIIFALEPKTGTSARGEWKVQEFVLETLDGQFSRKMVFSVFGEERLQRFNIQVGQDVKVSFDIDAREYNGRWFNSIRAHIGSLCYEYSGAFQVRDFRDIFSRRCNCLFLGAKPISSTSNSICR